jgi:hypothetical protein
MSRAAGSGGTREDWVSYGVAYDLAEDRIVPCVPTATSRHTRPLRYWRTGEDGPGPATVIQATGRDVRLIAAADARRPTVWGASGL